MNFSVLMSVYIKDRVQEVANAMSSILNQTYLPAQIVIVEDGPITQELQRLLDEYAERYSIIDRIRLEENMGLGRALNIGLEYCKYELVARMDADDFSLPYRFEKQIEFLINNPNVDILGGQIAEFDSTMNEQIGVRNVPLTMNEIQNKMKRRNCMNHVTVLYKKSSVIEAGNYIDCPYFEDYYLWCRMLKKGFQFRNLDSVLVNVRAGNEMYKRRGGKQYNKAIIDFQKKILNLGIINQYQFVLNLGIRLSVASLPNSIRGKIYRNTLRRQ